ncbi:MAG: hypothetical protein NTY07_13080 [Bacteroidia bacterium]|nr:hypothetical protein [Bacteroidia bacterium]
MFKYAYFNNGFQRFDTGAGILTDKLPATNCISSRTCGILSTKLACPDPSWKPDLPGRLL